MHRSNRKKFEDPATEGWFLRVIIKPDFITLVSQCKDRLKSERSKIKQQKIIEEYAERIAEKFNLRRRNFIPLIEEYLESGLISFNPFEIYGVTLVNEKDGVSLKLHPGIRKETLHKAVDTWWDRIDLRMSIANPAEHKKQFKKNKHLKRDQKIYELYLKKIIKYTGSLKTGYTTQKLKEMGVDPVPGIDMRKKIIVRLRNIRQL